MHAVGAQWAANKTSDQIAAWTQKGLDESQDELERVFQQLCSEEYGRLMRQVWISRHFLCCALSSIHTSVLVSNVKIRPTNRRLSVRS
jgi:hypothetical protein